MLLFILFIFLEYLLFTDVGYGCCIFHLLHFPFDRSPLFFYSQRISSESTSESRESFDIFNCHILQPRVNNSLDSYHFKTFKTIIKKIRIIFKSKDTRTTLNKVFKYQWPK